MINDSSCDSSCLRIHFFLFFIHFCFSLEPRFQSPGSRPIHSLIHSLNGLVLGTRHQIQNLIQLYRLHPKLRENSIVLGTRHQIQNLIRLRPAPPSWIKELVSKSTFFWTSGRLLEPGLNPRHQSRVLSPRSQR